MKKALIAMSGGVDSSVCAYLMKAAGYACIGATMRLFDNEDAGIPAGRTCCSLDDTEDARAVAYRLQIPYYVFNFTGDFREQVIGRFAEAYARGETPNPCIDCNRYMKFDRLHRRAEELGCDVVATGHYARIERQGERYLLKKAADGNKDQTYVLHAMTQEQLGRTVFPLGDLKKTDVRKIAEEHGFANAHKRDSQDICFAPDGDYAGAIERYCGRCYPPGRFVDKNGNALGRHKGIIHYTIGQRKGLGLALPEPMYVCEIRASDNTVVLCKNEELFSKSLDAAGFNWIACGSPPEKLRVRAKVRYKHPEQWATVYPDGPDRAHIEFDEAQRAITPGQAVVLYDGDIVVGGGTILAAGR